MAMAFSLSRPDTRRPHRTRSKRIANRPAAKTLPLARGVHLARAARRIDHPVRPQEPEHMEPEPMIDPRREPAGPTPEEAEAWADRERKRRQAWAEGPSEEEKQERARSWRRRAMFGLEESRLGPTREDIESWAERERKRRAAWLAGPGEGEKREWARRARRGGELPPSPEEVDGWARREQERRREWLAGPSEDEKREWALRQGRAWEDAFDTEVSETARRFFREAELAGKGSLFALSGAPAALWSYFVRAGRAFEEEFYQPPRRRRVRY
jgi:hypothetical protein